MIALIIFGVAYIALWALVVWGASLLLKWILGVDDEDEEEK